MGLITLPEQLPIVNGLHYTTTNGALTGDYISCKDALRVTIIAKLFQAATHETTLGLNEATAVAPSGATPVTAVQRIWKDADTSSSDAMVPGTDAATVSATAGTNNQILVMQFDPATLSDGFTAIAATLTASSEATNFADITYIIETRYPQATPPTAITD